MITIQGKGVSAGVGVGPLYYYRRATAEIKRYTVEDTDAEWHRFKGAQTGAVEQLGQLAEQARAEAGDEAAMLFETHQMMAEDLDYEEAIEDRITNQKMNCYLKEISEICGIEKNLTFHLARHTFATTMTLGKGVPIETVSKMLGHTNVQTTQIYARITNDKISKDMNWLSQNLGNLDF